MVYGVIIEKDEKFYTHLEKLFCALDNMQQNYKWLISNHECWPSTPSIQEILKNEYCILSGQELTDIANTEDFQWIWGTFSAFEPDVSNEDILKHPLPKNDMYGGFWELPLTMQHPLAKIEIVAWDATLTLIFTKDFSILETLKKFYPKAEDLEIHNKENTL